MSKIRDAFAKKDAFIPFITAQKAEEVKGDFHSSAVCVFISMNYSVIKLISVRLYVTHF